MFFVYVLYSTRLDRYYTGQTDDLGIRLQQHNNIENKNSTRKGQPWELYLEIPCKSRLQAVRIERYIKKMKSRKYIKSLKTEQEKVKKLLEAHDC